ncbi:MAG: SPFH domain-containing protein [Candidatus Obscuribacterales bacterium]|nr:SPFH domain-containing protein [Candidatus Obscuribacterales bacterium]
MFGVDLIWWFGGVVVVIAMFAIGSLVANMYQKCSPNQAMIISGMWAGQTAVNEIEGDRPRKFTIVVGGGAVVLPMVQQRNFLSLEIMTIEVHAQAPMITRNGVPIFVEGVAQVKVKGDDYSIATAAEQFLGKSDVEIANIAHESLVGHLRAILGTMTVEELIQSFDSFAQRVQEVSLGDLAKMGLTVVSFTIKEIKDSVGYLEALGRQQTAEAKRNADIGVAHASKETAIAQAQAQRDSQIAQANAAEEGAKAKLAADTRVAEASKNFQVSQASYQADVANKKAASDMMYDIVKAQTQQKLVEETQKIKIIEAQKEVELQQVEVMKRQVQLEQEVTKPAEAEQTRIRLMTQAEQEKRKMLAEADALSAKLQAQGAADSTRLRALADAEATKANGLAHAEASRAQGIAEATVTAAKGQAEAEAMGKKAEAFKQYNDAAMTSMIIERLPEIVAAAAAPLSKIGSMTVLSTGGDGSGSGASKVTSDVLNVAAQSMMMIKGLTGIDIADALRKDRKALPDNGSSASAPAKPKDPANIG